MSSVRILSIDGGGVRGIIPALVLAELESMADAPVQELFDLVAGTSTGGILGSTLAADRPGGDAPWRAEEVADLYRDSGGKIFHRSFWKGVASMGGLVDEKYDHANLEDVLRERLGQAKLSQAKPELLVTAYDIEHRKPFFFKSWRARQSPERDFLLQDVVRATSAAPTYFEPADAKNVNGESHYLVDGGVYANNPAACALSAARRLHPGAERFVMLSLGTGITKREIPFDEAKDWGLAGWARPLLYMFFDGVCDVVSYQMDQEADLAHLRLDIKLGNDPDDPNDDLDDASPHNIQRLEDKARELISLKAHNLHELAVTLKA
jgi:hypothetical protein